MDRPFDILANQGAIGPDLGFEAVADRIKLFARTQHPAFDHLTERHAGFGAFRSGNF